MATGFGFDPQAVREVSQQLVSVRSDLGPAWQWPGGGPDAIGSPAISAELRQFTDASAQRHAAVAEAVQRVSARLDALAGGEREVDQALRDRMPPGQ